MNNNLEFENEDPSPDSIEDNHPRTNYGEGYYVKETFKEDAEQLLINDYKKIVGEELNKYELKLIKWLAASSKKYSEEDMKQAYLDGCKIKLTNIYHLEKWFEKFKKK